MALVSTVKVINKDLKGIIPLTLGGQFDSRELGDTRTCFTIDEKGVLSYTPNELYVNPDLEKDEALSEAVRQVKAGSYSNTCLDLRDGETTYQLTVEKNQVTSVRRFREQVWPANEDVLHILLAYITDDNNIWDKTKYLGNSKRSGKVFGVHEASIAMMYVRGNAFVEGMIDDAHIELTYSHLQGFQVEVWWNGVEDRHTKSFPPHRVYELGIWIHEHL